MGGGPLGGLYKSKTNELVIFASHDGKYSEGTIKHELIHYLETLFGKNYDADKISQCKKDLDKKLAIPAILCIDNPTKKECDQIREYASHYQDRTVKKLSNLVTYEADRDNPNSGVLAMLTINENFPKLKSNGAIVRVIKDGDFSILQLEGIQSVKTGIARKATQDEKNLFNMALGISEAPNREVINRSYLRASSTIRDSEHYAELVGSQPEKPLNQICPNIVPSSHQALANSKAKNQILVNYKEGFELLYIFNLLSSHHKRQNS